MVLGDGNTEATDLGKNGPRKTAPQLVGGQLQGRKGGAAVGTATTGHLEGSPAVDEGGGGGSQ